MNEALPMEFVRRCIEARTCPFCGKGPYRMIALHTNLAHNVDKYELRDLGGYKYDDHLSDPESTELRRRRIAPYAEQRRGKPSATAGKKLRKKRYTKVGKAAQLAAVERGCETRRARKKETT